MRRFQDCVQRPAILRIRVFPQPFHDNAAILFYIILKQLVTNHTTFQICFFFSLGLCLPTRCRCADYCCSRSHSVTHTLRGTSRDEWSTRCRDLNLTTHNTNKREASMPPQDSKPQSQQASSRRPTP